MKQKVRLPHTKVITSDTSPYHTEQMVKKILKTGPEVKNKYSICHWVCIQQVREFLNMKFILF